jgi:uncharacterized protein DUF6640
MDVLSDGNLLARILATLATVGYAFITILADFNKTHATNPKWTPHARFHVVWQISSYCGFGLLALGLIWWPGSYAVERLYLACAFAAIAYGAFFVALATMPLYGGRAYDDKGYLPFAAPLWMAALGRQHHCSLGVFRCPDCSGAAGHAQRRRRVATPGVAQN